MFLIISSGLNVVSANITDENSTEIASAKTERIKESESESEETRRIGEKVNATSNGYQNITFDDGYSGYCANKYLKDADIGDSFIVQDTSKLVNPNYNESVGNYLKILFVDHYDYVMANQLSATLAVWEFTDNPYKTDSYLEIIPEILKAAQDGRIIPDHGETKKINNTTEAIFDFECLKSTDDEIQNFFAYKITYREILSEITGSLIQNETLENSETPDNKTTNNTTQNNETTNNTTQNNETTNNTTKTENKTENNITASSNDNNSSKVMAKDVDNKNLEKENNIQNHINVMKHTTGNNAAIGLGLLLFLTIILIIKYK